MSVIKLQDWKAGVQKGEILGPVSVRKQFVSQEVTAGEDRIVKFLITTGAVDRDNDTIDPNGWDLSNYIKNPVVLWSHDYYAPPVAKTLSITPTAQGLIAEAQFATAEEYPFADSVYRLLLGGYLNATSVGFAPQEWSYDEQRDGYNFSKQELLEFSIVPIPCNPEALVQAKSAGVDMEPLREWAERILDAWTEERGIYVPERQFEQIVKALWAKTLDEHKSFTVGKFAFEEQPDGAVEAEVTEETKAVEPEVKSGRAISAAHEAHLKQAMDCIQKVLSSVCPADDEQTDDGKAEEAEVTKAVEVEAVEKAESQGVIITADPRELAEFIKTQVQDVITSITGRVF